MTVHAGGCLCGAVRFRTTGDLAPVVNCHCGMCRRFHGAYGAYTRAPRDGFVLTEQSGLAWYESSPGIRRGFCRICGSSLFWEKDPRDALVEIAAGALDQPTGLRTEGHIYTAHRGDFYDITDGLWQRREGILSPITSGPSD